MRVHNKKESYARRKKLRTKATPQEVKLWGRLRKNQLGYRFRRQQSIGWYIVDFYCPEKKLAVEIDGSQHMESMGYDKMRTDFLNLRGISVLRFWDSDVDENIHAVTRKILNSLSTCP